MIFMEFPKIARLSRECVITEKIDGTNAQIYISDDGAEIMAGSRTRWITPEQDNYGFARWVDDNKDALLTLGPGRHFGEWWGGGVQRGYGFKKGEKFFSLFNTTKWGDTALLPAVLPKNVGVVPILWQGPFDVVPIRETLELLRLGGSKAAPGFMRPEGIVVFHLQGNVAFKKTLEKDAEHKGTA